MHTEGRIRSMSKYEKKTKLITCNTCGTDVLVKSNALSCEVCRGYDEYTKRFKAKLHAKQCYVCDKQFLPLSKKEQICYSCKTLVYKPNGPLEPCVICGETVRWHHRGQPICADCVDKPGVTKEIMNHFRQVIRNNQIISEYCKGTKQ